jgi:hypothetical protein
MYSTNTNIQGIAKKYKQGVAKIGGRMTKPVD